MRKRKLRNYLVEPKFQIKFGLFFFGFGLFASTLTQFIVYLNYEKLSQQIGAAKHLSPADQVWITENGQNVLLQQLGLLGLIFALICFGFGIVITHRVYGPLRKINRFVHHLAEGDYSGFLILRTNDELKELARNLNTLCDRLKKNDVEVKDEKGVA